MTGLVRLADSASASGNRRAGATASAPGARRTGGGALSFTREGEYWTMSHAGGAFRLKDSLGLRYLARLVASRARDPRAGSRR